MLKILGCVILIALGIRMLIVMGMFAISEAWKCKRPADMKINTAQSLRLLFAEWKALSILNALYQVFPNTFGRSDPPAAEHQKGAPIVLVHGFMCNAGYWRPMLKAMATAGITNTWTISLEPLGANIEKLADRLGERVEDVCAKSGADKVTLVGHSMGGLVSRAYAKRPEGGARVRQIITLGSPHHGTIHAQLSNPTNARQMRLGNPWLMGLNADGQHPAPIPITSIFSYHDNIVSPQDSSILKNADNVPIPGIGHLEMAFSKKFQDKVISILY